jgi:hypothetical protein
MLNILAPQVAYMFNRLKKHSPQHEEEWKNIFTDKVVLLCDALLEELGDEIGVEYKRDLRIEMLKKHREALDSN